MKTCVRSVLMALMAVTFASFTQASDLYWSANGSTLGGAGTWNTSDARWGELVAGPFGTTWNNSNNDTAIFSSRVGSTVTLGTGITVGGLQFNITGYTVTGNTLTFGAADNTITLNNVAAATIGSAVAGTGANVILTKANPANAGTVAFTGATTGGWSGTTTINPGLTVTLDAAASLNRNLLNTSAITLNGGAIDSGVIANNANGSADRINNSAAITVNSGSFTWGSSNAGGTYAETLGTVTLNRGQMNFTLRGNLSSGSQALTLGTSGIGLVQSGNAVVTFANNATAFNSSIASGNDVIRVYGITTSTPAGEIIGPWATVGSAAGAQTDYAKYSSDGTYGYIVPAAATLTAPGESGWSSSTTAYQFGAAATLSAARTAAALRYTGAAAALGLGASTYSLETYGLLNGGSGVLTVSTTGTGALTTPSGGGNLYLTTGSNGITVSAPIKNNGGNVTVVKSGSGSLTLSSTTSDYSGGTVLNAGTLVYTANANLGASGSRNITFNGAATLTGFDGSSLNQLTANSGAVGTITANNITFATTTGSGSIVYAMGNKTLNLGDASAFNGSVRMTADSGQTIQFSKMGDAVGCGNLQYAGGSGDGGQSLTMALAGNAGPLTLSNRRIEFLSKPFNWSFLNANLKNNNGTAANKLVINTPLANYLDRDHNFILGGTNTGDNEFAGVIGDSALGYKYDGVYNSNNNLAINGILNLQKVDGGTWRLSGTNTYSGATSVTAGKLFGVTGGSCSNSAVTVSAGTLGVSVTDNTKQWTCKSLTHTAASTLEFAFGAIIPSTTVAPLQVNGNVFFAVAPAVSCTGSSLPAGTYPLMKWTGTFSGVAPSSLTLTSGTGILVLDNANKTLWLSISAAGASKQPLTWKGPSTSTWVANEAVYTKWQDATAVSTNYQETTVSGITVGDNVVFGTTGAGTVTLNTTVSPASVAVNPTVNYAISGTGSIAGPGGLTKTGSGILTLATANSYSGGTSLGAGTLSIGINDALGTGLVVLSGGTIQSSDATARTLNNPVVLNGSSIVGGTGNLSFTSPADGSVAAASTVTVNGSLNATFATAFGGSGSITKAGTGTLTLTGTNTYTGITTINAGSIVLNNDGDVTGSTVSFNANNTGLTVTGGSGVTSIWNAGGKDLTTSNLAGTGLQFTIDGAGTAGSARVTNVGILAWGRAGTSGTILLTNGGQMNVNDEVRTGSTYYGSTGGANITIGGGTATSTFTGNSGKAFYIGHGEREGSNGNVVTVTSGGVLTSVGDMFVGHVNNQQGNDLASTANRLTVTGTGTASMTSITVGYTQNAGIVSAPEKANANVVQVTSGGTLTTSGVDYIGRATANYNQANNNTVTVTGTDSRWNAGNQIVYVGYTGNSLTGAESTGNVLTVSTGGVVTNISTLNVKAANKLSLGAGGVVFAGAVINPGTLAVTIDGGATPPCGRLNVTGNLNLSNATLDVTVNATPGVPCVIASYGSLTGTFAATNGLPENYSLDMNFNGQNQIVIQYKSAGTIIMLK